MKIRLYRDLDNMTFSELCDFQELLEDILRYVIRRVSEIKVARQKKHIALLQEEEGLTKEV